MDSYLDLLYLDRSFISALYEIETGAHPAVSRCKCNMV